MDHYLDALRAATYYPKDMTYQRIVVTGLVYSVPKLAPECPSLHHRGASTFCALDRTRDQRAERLVTVREGGLFFALGGACHGRVTKLTPACYGS